MLAEVCSAAVNGIEAYPVEVEVNAGYGDTLIVIVSCILLWTLVEKGRCVSSWHRPCAGPFTPL